MIHGLWTTEELVTINQGKNNHLITEFLNEKTFLEHEIKIYPYNMRHKYLCEWMAETDEGDDITSETIYATDPESLKWYLLQNVDRLPDVITEIITTTKDITLD
jgi:hypothetical protein